MEILCNNCLKSGKHVYKKSWVSYLRCLLGFCLFGFSSAFSFDFSRWKAVLLIWNCVIDMYLRISLRSWVAFAVCFESQSLQNKAASSSKPPPSFATFGWMWAVTHTPYILRCRVLLYTLEYKHIIVPFPSPYFCLTIVPPGLSCPDSLIPELGRLFQTF